MSRQRFSDGEIERMREMHCAGHSWRQVADEFDATREIVRDACRRRGQYKHPRPANNTTPNETPHPRRVFRENKDKNEATLDVITTASIKTYADAIRACEVDESIWYVHDWSYKAWTTPLKVGGGQDEKTRRWRAQHAVQQQQYLVSLKLRRKSPEILSLESLLDEISKKGRIKLPVCKHKVNRTHRRALEISIMDPHMGLRCFQPAAGAAWSPEQCEQAYMATVERLLKLAKAYGPFEKIVAPIGNDYLHADNVHHTTTAGTPQPESDAIQDVILRGEKLLQWKVERLRKEAPVDILAISGNHARLVEFLMARIIRAYYLGAGAKDVFVDASPSPYKFWRFGATLVGFEHGHSIKPHKLPGLMAQETRLNHWQDSRYCIWHLGDQHRKASSRPSQFEELGVAVDFLPSLTPPNEWSKIKGYNWQQRGGMAFVYDYDAGPIATLQVNFDNYTGKFMGEK